MKFLVVDDEKPALGYMKKILEELEPGCSVECVNNAREAFDLAVNEDFDAVFLDIRIGENNGIELAKQIKLKKREINFIFTTGYTSYMGDAFRVDASDYLMKPIIREEVRHALDNLRYEIETESKKPVIKCFGNFEILANGEPLKFQYQKSKELLAYLVYKNGASCSKGELQAALWEDEVRDAYYRRIKKDLVDTLKAHHIDIIYSSRGSMAMINPGSVECDYFSWLKDEPAGINAYNGEFMEQYSWSEYCRI